MEISEIYSHAIFDKNFVKATVLLKKLLKNWFHGKSFRWERWERILRLSTLCIHYFIVQSNFAISLVRSKFWNSSINLGLGNLVIHLRIPFYNFQKSASFQEIVTWGFFPSYYVKEIVMGTNVVVAIFANIFSRETKWLVSYNKWAKVIKILLHLVREICAHLRVIFYFLRIFS